MSDFEEWQLLIQTPAEKENEGWRRLDSGPATAEYLIAPLPDGRTALRFHCKMEGDSGMNCPWRAYQTRQQAVDAFREQTLAFFQRVRKLKASREEARRKIMELLAGGGLFGFQEPDPA